MKRNMYQIFILTLFFLSFLVWSSITVPIHGKEASPMYTDHNPIFIDSDDDFITLGFLGNGNPSNPYLITGYNITNSTTTLIHIQDTTKFFKIINNSLNAIDRNYAGIHFHNVTHGFIVNNSIQNCYNGLHIDSSFNNTVSNNTVFSNGFGVRLSYSNRSLIFNNTLYDNTDGIRLQPHSYFNTLSNNTIFHNAHHGIELDYSSFNILINNHIYENQIYGIFFYEPDSDNNLIVNNRIINNTNTGIVIDLSANSTISNNNVSHNGAGGIHIINSINITTTNNFALNNCYKGIELSNSSYGEISDNSVLENVGGGIYLESNSDNNSIFNNTVKTTVTNPVDGITIGNSHNNTISTNTVSITDRSIIIYSTSSNNLVFNNNASDSGTGIRIDGISNFALNNSICNSKRGIFTHNGENTTIINNRILDIFNPSGDGEGIWLGRTNHAKVLNNTIVNVDGSEGCPTGIRTDFANYAVISGNIVSNIPHGIWIGNSNRCIIENNNITNGYDNGIGIAGLTSENLFLRNYIVNCTTACIHSMGQGISNTIINNTFKGFAGQWNCDGIMIDHGMATGYLIQGNYFSSPSYGITAQFNNSLIMSNIFDKGGLNLHGYNNTVTLNSFLDCCNPDVTGNNSFDFNGFGNYWSTYSGSDIDNNGIGDTPYTFSGGVDNYPLMNLPETYVGQIILFQPTNGSLVRSGTTVIVSGVNLIEDFLVSWDDEQPLLLVKGQVITVPSGEGLHILRIWANTTNGEQISAYYQFTVDNTPPSIDSLSWQVTATSISLSIGTSEPTRLTIYYGKAGEITSSYLITDYSTSHSFKLTDLQLGEMWVFYFELNDQVGNTFIENNDGYLFNVTTAGILINLEYPINGSIVQGMANIQFYIFSVPNSIITALLKIPELGWVTLTYDSGLSLWTYSWDTTNLADGQYELEYKVEDSGGDQLTGKLVFIVQNNPSTSSSSTTAETTTSDSTMATFTTCFIPEFYLGLLFISLGLITVFRRRLRMKAT